MMLIGMKQVGKKMKRSEKKMNTKIKEINKFEVTKNNLFEEETVKQKLPVMKPIKEMSELTGLSYTLLRSLCIQNKIIFIKTGKKYLINYDKFIDFLNSGEPA